MIFIKNVEVSLTPSQGYNPRFEIVNSIEVRVVTLTLDFHER